jgi:uncharacterized protein with HEPN domain
MPRDPRKYLFDMLDRAQFVTGLLRTRTIDDLVNDRVLRSAVERELSIVGEALMQLNAAAPAQAQRIHQWREIIGFRHVLVHGYGELNMQTIWDTVRDDLPVLIEQVEAMLNDSTA